MASSSSSSPATPPRGAGSPWPARSRFALTGPSEPLDPTRFPVRPDLADIALADRVFAPHYARALNTRAVVDGVAVRVGAQDDADVVGMLAEGDVFRVLEIGKTCAWGQVGDDGAIGYVDRHALVADPA